MQNRKMIMIGAFLTAFLIAAPSVLATEVVSKRYRLVGNDDNEFLTLDMSPDGSGYTHVIVSVTDENFDATHITVWARDDSGNNYSSSGCGTQELYVFGGIVEVSVKIKRGNIDGDNLCFASEGTVEATYS